jgi:5-methylcytosine-specific restriction endonuclease McrA
MSYKRPLKSYLVENSPYQSNKLRIRLLVEGIKPHQCEVCGNSTWNNKLIPLELDHINGVNNDNRLENLRIICPNCHAQTEHYRGNNWGKAARKHHYSR